MSSLGELSDAELADVARDLLQNMARFRGIVISYVCNTLWFIINSQLHVMGINTQSAYSYLAEYLHYFTVS